MNTGWIITIIIAAAAVVLLLVLRNMSKKAEKRQAEADEQIAQTAQQVTMLIIDKKKLRMRQSGLPEYVISSTPWYARLTKVPVVKAKIGPKIMLFVADNSIFDIIPVKKEVKATISGIYISDVRGVRGPLERPAKNVGFFRRLMGEK